MIATRPNGKVYRSRKSPAGLVLNDYEDNVQVLVIRIVDYLEAYDIAVFTAYMRLGREFEVRPLGGEFGWWHEGIRNHDTWWDRDSARGCPGYSFPLDPA